MPNIRCRWNSRSREFQLARWISSDDRKKLDAFIAANGSGIADDVDGDPVFMAKNEFYLGYTRERAEGIDLFQRQGREEEGVRRPALLRPTSAVVLRESGGPSTPRPLGKSLPSLEYWIVRSSRTMTARGLSAAMNAGM